MAEKKWSQKDPKDWTDQDKIDHAVWQRANEEALDENDKKRRKEQLDEADRKKKKPKTILSDDGRGGTILSGD